MRVVSLTCSNTEILESLGRLGDLVGVDDHSDWPVEALRDVPRLGPDLSIDLDAVAALEPDLVLASLTVPGHETIVEGLRERGLPFVAPEPTSLVDVASDLREIGAALGRAAEGERAAQRFEEALIPSEMRDVSLIVEWWPKPVYVPGADSWVTEMIRLAGGFNPFENEPVKSFALEPERAVQAGVEAVAISWCGVPTRKYRPRVVARREGWEQVPAVQRGTIVPISEAFLGRPGPRLVHGLAALRDLVERADEARG